MNKVKVSVTVSADVLARVDRHAARRRGATRSQIIEEWLRRGARVQAQQDLESEIVAYYDGLTAEQRAEDAAIATATARAARRLDLDGPRATKKQRG